MVVFNNSKMINTRQHRLLRLLRFSLALILAGLLLVACDPGTPAIETTPLTTLMASLTPPSTTVAQPDVTIQAPVTEIPAPVSPTSTLPPGPTAQESFRFAIIGDYGEGGDAERDVADLVKSWNPDFIITVGDNNYPDGAYETIDQNIGKFYHEYIYSYLGSFGEGADSNRFFPSLGNHDWTTDRAQPYLDYFTLPGNERYYDFVWGPAHFFAINSDSREPDGVSRSSPQAQWLQSSLAASASPWKLVYFHAPPYSSGLHGSVDWMRWPFQKWGASAVFSGHDHVYERLMVNDLPYFINGLGGGPRYYFVNVLETSQVRFSDDWGAMLVTYDSQQISFQFITRSGEIIDDFQLIR